MPRNPSTWAEYGPAPLPFSLQKDEPHWGDSPSVVLRVFGSEVADLRSAVSNGNRVVRLEFGLTIDEALTAAEHPRQEQVPLVPKIKRPASDVVHSKGAE